jgi:lipopolysaccharide/colanic/teichoic acid biosynthesis glycosyltransferase
MSVVDTRPSRREDPRDAGSRVPPTGAGSTAETIPAHTVRREETIPLMTAAERRYERWKRVLDVTVALTSLILLSPILLLMAIAIKLTSRGPVFYQGTVHGRYGKPFTWHKFRSMRIDSSDSAHREFIQNYVAESRSGGSQQPGTLYKLTPDPRITQVGAIMRKTSLDEMAQMFDVLRGHMSIVGPRPPVPYEYDYYSDEDKARLAVLPGITGLAQVRARSKCSFAEMVALDREYIQNRSIVLDLQIMWETVWVVLRGKGAY